MADVTREVNKYLDKISLLQNQKDELRKSREALADKIGIDRTTISAYEREVKKPNIEVFYKICDLCNTEMCFKINNKIYTIDQLKRGF